MRAIVHRSSLIAAICLLSAMPCRAATDVAGLVSQLDVAVYTDILDNMLETRTGDNRGFLIPELSPAADHDLVRDRIYTWFDNLGLDASLDPFTFSSFTGMNNVIGVLPGRITPGRVYIIGGHYDSVQNPGADDNASGVAGVMEAARILANQPLASTVMFVAWDGEERGLWGSYHWVWTNDESVVDGVVNLDMIAYNHNDDNIATVYGRADWRAKWIAAAGRYAPDITVLENTETLANSDHYPFQRYEDRPAGGIIENTGPSPNPYYHKITDTVDTPGYIDYEYAVSLLASGVGLLAEEADLLLPGDADNDKTVGYDDLAILAAHIGTAGSLNWTTGDFNADGVVDAADYIALKQNFGLSIAPTRGSEIPEPGTVLLLAVGAALVLWVRKKRP